MSILSKIAELLDNTTEPVPSFQTKAIHEGHIDSEDMFSGDEKPLSLSNDFYDSVFLISYIGASGEETERTIRIKDFTQKGEKFYTNAYCFSREAPRCFRIDRINLIADADTGEVISENSIIFFQSSLEGLEDKGSKPPRKKTVKDFGKAYNMLYPGIKTLAYIARCDGHFHEKELSVIQKYCISIILSRDYEVPFDEDTFTEYARRQCPSHDNFKKSISLVQNRDSAIGNRIIKQSIAALIEADGHIHKQEILAGDSFSRLWQEIEAIKLQERY